MNYLTNLICLIAFLLPWEYVGSFNIYNITIRPSQLAALAAMFCFLFLLAAKKITLKNNFLTKPALIFLGVELISVFVAQNKFRSLQVLAYTTFVMMVAYLIQQVIDDEEKLKKILKFLLLGSLAAAVFGIYQYLGDVAGLPLSATGLRPNYTKAILGIPRMQGPALEPLYFANYLLLPISWLIIGLSWGLYQAKKFWCFLGLLLTVFCLTISRSGYLALAVIGLLFLIGQAVLVRTREFKIKLNQFIKADKKLILIGSLSLLAAYFFLLLPYNFKATDPLNFFTKHTTNFTATYSYLERMGNDQLAWQAFKDKPILGIGIGNFGPYAVENYYKWLDEFNWPIVNNEPLEILAETGLLGGLAMLYFLFVLFKNIRLAFVKSPEFLFLALSALTLALIGVIIQYQFFSILYIMQIWFLIGLLAAVISQQSPVNSR